MTTSSPPVPGSGLGRRKRGNSVQAVLATGTGHWAPGPGRRRQMAAGRGVRRACACLPHTHGRGQRGRAYRVEGTAANETVRRQWSERGSSDG